MNAATHVLLELHFTILSGTELLLGRSWPAVRARCPGDNMTFGLLDLERASWVAMLGLDELSVALDIGSGYGAITHAFSRRERRLLLRGHA